MTGASGPQADPPVEDAPKATNPLREKDPAGWDAWLVLLKGSADAREGMEEETIDPAMDRLVKDWQWPSPGNISRAPNYSQVEKY